MDPAQNQTTPKDSYLTSSSTSSPVRSEPSGQADNKGSVTPPSPTPTPTPSPSSVPPTNLNAPPAPPQQPYFTPPATPKSSFLESANFPPSMPPPPPDFIHTPQPLAVSAALPPLQQPEFPKALIAAIVILIVIGGFGGSFFFFQTMGKPKTKLATLPPITPPVTIIPTITSVNNPFLSPTSAPINPFISPTPAFDNPFGSYENPFTSANETANAENQLYKNPFEGVK